MRLSGSPPLSPSTPPTPPCALTRSTWSPGPPPRSTKCDVSSRRDAKRIGAPSLVTRIKGCRYALLKNPQNLTENQRVSLARVAAVNKSLYRAYLLKEEFRLIFQLRGADAIVALDGWLRWAQRCRLPAFVELYHRIKKHRSTIEATLNSGLSNALVESTNTKLRLLTRMAYGFRSTDNLIALCLLDRGGYCPPLPGRQAP